jgi:arginyl-tRNA--protein-N-Asp/Glu arginylyltransferase
MSYKTRFKPFQVLINHRWLEMADATKPIA